MTKEQLLQSFKHNQSLYLQKRSRLDGWKQEFQQLEEDIHIIKAVLEQKYEELTISDEFVLDVIEKLENRKEGIRLSVKSASRLLKKWNPEREVQESELPFITSEILAKQIMQNRGPDELDEFTLEENPGKPDQELHDEESVLADFIEQETVVIEETEEKAPSPDSNDMLILKDAIQTNETALEELEDCIEKVEKRFVTFFEKAAAPVLDGLYSGKKFAVDWSKELEETDHEQRTEIDQWLTVYDDLLNELTRFFDVFSVQLYIPEAETLFNEETQEPIGVIEDAELEDEQIKEVVRFGLVYGKEIYGQEDFLIRPAQVTVVKNKQQDATNPGEGHEQ